MTAPNPHPLWFDVIEAILWHCYIGIAKKILFWFALCICCCSLYVTLIFCSLKRVSCLSYKKISTKKRENNAKNNRLFRYFYLYTWYFRFSSISPFSSIFLSFSRFFIVFRNISLDLIWISRNWAALNYFAFPNTDTTTEITMMMLKT